jgi:hypothetical protein
LHPSVEKGVIDAISVPDSVSVEDEDFLAASASPDHLFIVHRYLEEKAVEL